MISTKNSSFKISVGIRNATDFSPFGVELKGRNFEVSGGGNYRYSFQGQESDSEVKGEGNSVNYSFRMHDPRLGRFFNIDILSPSFPYYSPYLFSGNRVIDCGELEGMEPKPKIKGQESKLKEGVKVDKQIEHSIVPLTYHNGGKYTEPGYYSASDYRFITKKIEQNVKSATSGFKWLNPVDAWNIGTADWDDFDISTSASTFSTNIHIAGISQDKAQANDGTRTNAFRHTFWQALITLEIDSETAEEIGYAHESCPNLDLVSPDQRVFVTSYEADNWVDLMNNRIGRTKIADIAKGFMNDNIEIDRLDIAIYTLEYFHSNGLWVTSQTPDKNGQYSVMLHKLSDEDYYRSLENLGNCDEYGYNSADTEMYNKDADSKIE